MPIGPSDNAILIRRMQELLSASPKQKILWPNIETIGVPGPDDKELGIVVPRPAQYQPEPLLDPSIARDFNQIRKYAPDVQGQVKSVRIGPTDDFMQYLDLTNKTTGSKWKPSDVQNLNLRGVTNPRTGNVSMNTNFDDSDETDSRLAILGHELTHTMGLDHETGSREIEKLIQVLKMKGIFK